MLKKKKLQESNETPKNEHRRERVSKHRTVKETRMNDMDDTFEVVQKKKH